MFHLFTISERLMKIVSGTINECGVAGILIILASLFLGDKVFAVEEIEFNIPSQRADRALTAFARTANIPVLFPNKDIRNITTNALYGRYNINKGLGILLENKGLLVSRGSSGQLIVKLELSSKGETTVPRATTSKKKHIFSGVAAFLASVFVVSPGYAQGQQGASDQQVARQRASVLEEIIVTAQKREQSIQDVGITITAYSGYQIKALGFEDSSDIAAMTPGVYISGAVGGQQSLFTIRGVTQNDFNDTTESPIAVYVDDSYVGFSQGQLFGMFDLERVEVLKGPQGTLFGRNATGGLIHYISRKPTQELEGYGEVTYGSYNQARFEGAVGGPLSDTLAARAAVFYNRFDEIIDNDYPNRFVTLNGAPLPIGGEDIFNDDSLAFRGQLLFQPNEDIEFLLIGNYARSRLSTAPLLEIPTVPILNAAGIHVGTILAGPTETREAAAPDGTPLNHRFSFDGPDTQRAVPGGNLYGPSCTQQNLEDLNCSLDFAFDDLNTTDSHGISGNLTWDFDAFTLTAISDYKSFDKFFAVTGSGGPASTTNTMFEAKAETFTQELRLNGEFERGNWVAGVYYLNIDVAARTAITAEETSLFQPFVGAAWGDATISQLGTDSWSVFGQLEFGLSEQLTFIAGLRGIQENKDFSGEEGFYLSTNPLTLDTDTLVFPVQPRSTHKQNATLWSGKVQLDWQPLDNLLIFGSFNRGVKAGGFNTTFTFGAGFPVTDIPYKDETLLAFETGFKVDDLFGGTTRINGSFFYYDYSDYQGFFFSQVTGFVTNVDAEYKGVELELFSAPVEGLNLGLNLSYLDAKVFDIQLGPGLFVDTEPTFSPEIQLAGLLRYEWPQRFWGGYVSAQASFNYASTYFENIRNFEASKLPAYVIGNLRLGWRSEDDRWQGTFFINNVANQLYYRTGFDTSTATGANSRAPGKPRWFGANLRYNFF